MAAPKHVVNRRWTAADLHTTARAWPTDPTPPTDPAAAAAASTPKPATAGALVSTRVPQQRRTATFHTPAAPQSLATVPYGPRARSLSVSLRSLQAMRSLASQHAPFALKEGAEGGGEQLHERQGGDVAPVPDLVVVRRASAHVRRLCVEWRDLGCSYDTHAGTRVVLQGVYGRVSPGDLLGLLGPSGAGKSTLLDILAARKHVGRLSGSVLVDGRPRDAGAFVRKSAYVPQDDHFMPVLTAGEVLAFHAALVLRSRPGRRGTAGAAAGGAAAGGGGGAAAAARPQSLGQLRRQRCKEVLAAMGLAGQTNTLVGGVLPGGLQLRGLSGGERKRLAIATGIVAAPSALLLDEPTSGLDAAAALGVMRYMAALADAGHVVLASVHQPRAAIWDMFSQVVILSAGRMMYSGPRAGAVPWFTEGLGYSYEPARHGVAADWVLDLVNTTFKKPRRVYGRMMTTKHQVDAAADAFLAHYMGEQQQHQHQQLPGGNGTSALLAGTDAAPPPPCVEQQQQHQLQEQEQEGAARSGSCGGCLGGAVGCSQGRWPLTGHRSASSGGAGGPSAAASNTAPGTGTAGARSRSAGGAPPPHAPATAQASTFTPLPHPWSPSGDSAAASAGTSVPAPPPTTASPSRVSSYGGAAATGLPAHTHTLQPTRNTPVPTTNSSGGGAAAVPSHHVLSLLDPAHDGAQHGSRGARHTLAAMAGSLRPAAKDAAASAAGWLQQVRVLTWRELLAVTRNPADVAGRTLVFCWVGVVVGLIFYSLGTYFESLRSRMDVMFIETCVVLLLPYVYMSLYTADKQYYTADLSAKLYSPSAYYAAKVLAVLPFGVVSALVFSLSIYGMAGLRHSGVALARHGLLATLAYLIASQVLYAAAVATPNQDTAFMVAIAWTAVNILMSNYLVRYADMRVQWLPAALRWFSVMAWAFQGMAATELRGQAYNCSAGFGRSVSPLSVLPEYLPGNPMLHPTNFAEQFLGDPGPECSLDTEELLQHFGMTEPFWRLVVILVGYLAATHVVTFLALRLTAGREKR